MIFEREASPSCRDEPVSGNPHERQRGATRHPSVAGTCIDIDAIALSPDGIAAVGTPRGGFSIDAERRFFAWLCSAILVMAVIGFTRTYLLVPALGMPADTPRYTPLIHLHATIMFAWCVLLAVQAWLVAGGRIALHRRLGIAGFALYLAMVAVGPIVAIHSVIRYGPDELSFLAVSLGNVVAHTLLLGAAFHWRRRPDLHKRLMCLGMVALLTAPFGRLAELPLMLQHVVGPGLVVVALAAWDLHARGRVHPVTLWLGPAMLLWELLPNLYMESEPWLRIAHWLVGFAP